MAFLSKLFYYIIVLLISVVVAGAGCALGISMRKKKNEKMAAENLKEEAAE